MRFNKAYRSQIAFAAAVLTILVLAVTGCGTLRSDSAASQSQYSVAVPNEDAVYSFNKPPFISPRIIQDLSCWLSDQGDHVVAINVGDSQNSNRYYGEPEIRHVEGRNPCVCWNGVTVQQSETNTTEFSYQYVGRTDSGTEVLATADSGGGSAVFRTLLLLKLEYDQGISCDWEKGVVKAGKKRLLLKKLGEIPLGDRWSGDLSVKGNSIFVGKDKGWFSLSGGTGGGPLSVAPTDRLLKIDLRSKQAKELR